MTFRTDPFLCPDIEKISNFHPDVKNLHFSVRTLNFVLKRPVIGPIMHKNEIKHENIRFRGVFGAEGAENFFFDPLSTRYNGISKRVSKVHIFAFSENLSIKSTQNLGGPPNSSLICIAQYYGYIQPY